MTPLARALLRAEAALAPDRLDETSSRYGSADYDAIKGDFADRVDRALRSADSGRLAQGERQFQRAVADSYRAAYLDGLGRWGRADLRAADEAWLRRAVSGEGKYARAFAADVAAGRSSPAQRAQRAQLYVDGLDSVRTSGWVEGAPDDVVFEWVLGSARHCSECPAIALYSPYTKETLPTVPRGGSTPCLARCACSLVVVERRGRPPKAPLEAPERAHGETTHGREPSAEERAQIDELRSRVNYWRRALDAAATPAEEAEAARERREANAALIELVQGRGLREVPLLSVGEVITVRDARPEAVEAILERGVDGVTLEMLSEAGFSQGLRDLFAAHEAFLKPRE